MFDIGWSELLLIAMVALIVIGPKDLPGFFHALGQWSSKLRSIVFDFKNLIAQAANESGLDTVGPVFDDLKRVQSPPPAVTGPLPPVLNPHTTVPGGGAVPLPGAEPAGNGLAVSGETGLQPLAAPNRPTPPGEAGPPDTDGVSARPLAHNLNKIKPDKAPR